MNVTRKTFWKWIAIAFVVLCVLSLSTIGVLQSNWFRNEIRKRIISQVQMATGGAVDIENFDYNWRNLTADLNGFVIHGKELPLAAPLFRVERARVTVRVISVFERTADISSIILTRPQVNLIVGPDGSTNLPTPPAARTAKDPIAELFALKLKQFIVTDGLVVSNDKRVPVNVRADGVELSASYLKAGPSYNVSLSSRQVDLGFGNLLRGPLRLSASASIGKDRVFVQKVEFIGDSTKIAGSAVLEHFAHPSLNFQLDASAAVNDILPLLKFTYVRGGKATVRGAGHFDEGGEWSFNGKAEAEQTAVETKFVSLKGIKATGDVEANAGGLVVRQISGSARGARFTGEANIKNYRVLSFDGNLSSLSLREGASFFTNRPLAWQGVANGRVRGGGALSSGADDFTLEADLQIGPGSAGIPVSGAVNLKYFLRNNALDFSQSHLSFPHSELLFSGSLNGQNQVVLDSSDLNDLKPIVPLLALKLPAESWPVLGQDGHLHYVGVMGNLLASPNFSGDLQVSSVRFENQSIDGASAKFNATENGIDFASFELRQGDTHMSGTGLIGLVNWLAKPDSVIRGALAVHGLTLAKVATFVPQIQLPLIQGVASGTVQLRGTWAKPEGSAHIASDSLDAYGERLNQAEFDADLTGNRLQVSKGRMVSGAAVLNFSGDYDHQINNWSGGTLRVRVDSNGFPLASLSPVRKFEPAFDAHAELHFEAAVLVGPNKLEPLSAAGTIQLSKVTWNKVPYGSLVINSSTHEQFVDAVITGDFRDNLLRGTAKVALAPGNNMNAAIDFERINLTSLYSAFSTNPTPMFDGTASAKLSLDGSLQKLDQMRMTLTSDKLELSSRLQAAEPGKPKRAELVFHNSGPIVAELFKNVATVRSFRMEGDQTALEITGTVPLDTKKPLDLKVAGTLNLHAYHLFDPNVESSGVSDIVASIGGTPSDPTVNGTLNVKNGAFFPENIPNGLSEVNGTVVFTRNRATLQKMTAKSGGGELALSGFLSFAGGGPLIYHLEGSADNVRVRYAGSISVTVSSKLRLSGTSTKSLLSGTLSVSRVVFNPNTDVGNLLASLGAASAAPGGENDFLNGLHLDVAIESAPNLQLSTSLSRDVEAEISLRLRGTLEHPVVLGSLSANQGDIQAFGNRYSINRGEITFSNPVKIEPTLDLDLETRARGVTVDITISGTFTKLNIAYRSDPPLQSREIIALLSLGRAPDSTDSTKTLRTNDTNALQSGANSLLGAAVISPVTNRLSKLFGITNIRIDPLVQGITNTPQTRVTLEQQISRDITITYVTNLSQTSEQIFRFEWAFSRQFSVVALRDDNGEFGIDFQYKKQFK